MINRNSGRDAAFAHILKVDGIEYKLARHHRLDDVRDGSEHDTVDRELLTFAINSINQLPVSEEERSNILTHLKEHETALAKLASEGSGPQPDDLNEKDVNRDSVENNPKKARQIVSQQAGGPDGNASINEKDLVMQPDKSVIVRTEEGTTVAVRQEGAGGSITQPTSTTTEKGEKDTDAGNPQGDKQDTQLMPAKDDVEKKDGMGTPAHPDKVSEGPVDSSPPGTIKDGGEKVMTNPAVDDPADVPVSKGAKATDKGSTPTKKGAEKGNPKAQKDDTKNMEPATDVEEGKNVKKK
jgi:hypothetical protein